MKYVFEFIAQYGFVLVYTVLTAIAGFLGAQAKRIYKKLSDDRIKKSVVENCVKAVEQFYHDLNGPEKREKAVAAITEMLAQKDIPVTDLEIHVLIESVIADFNYGFTA